MRRTRLSSLAAASLAALFVFTGTLPASATASEWGSPVTLSEAGQSAINPQLVTDGTTITAVWTRSDGSIYRVQASTSVDGGLTWSTPANLSEAGQGTDSPQLVTDGATTTVIWLADDGVNYRIQAASSNDGGLNWSTPATLSEAGESATHPQLVTNGTTLTATWLRLDGSNRRVEVASSIDDGLTWGDPLPLSEAGQDASEPRLVTDGLTVTATWRRSDGSNNRIQASSSVDGGLTWSTPATLSEAGAAAGTSRLVTDGTTITASWSRSDGSNNRIQAASSVDGGLSWSTPATLSEAGESAYEPQLVTDDTTITATWYRSDGSNDRIETASSVDGGLTWSTPRLLSEAGGSVFNPQLVTDGTTITATWGRSDGSNDRIQVSSSVDSGLTWSTPATLSDAGGSAYNPQLITDGTTITVIWFRYDGSKYLVQAASTVPIDEPTEPEVPLVDEPAEPGEPELAATGANEALATGLLASGLLLAGGALVVARVRGRRTA
jgi:hypothetical protein